MQLDTSTVYAINIMIHLAKQPRVVSSTELSRSLAISKRYLLKIAARLRDSSMIGVSFGPAGGYFLLKNPREFSVYDIITLMEGGVVMPYNARDGPDAESIFQDSLILLKGYVETYLRSLTLDKLVEGNDNEWLTEFSSLVESHIGSFRRNE